MKFKHILALSILIIGGIFVLLIKNHFTLSNKKTEATKITFLEFGSIGCSECKKMEAVQDSVKNENSNVIVKFIDIRKKENKILAKKYQIQLIPAQILLDKNEVEYFRHVGYIPYNELNKLFNHL